MEVGAGEFSGYGNITAAYCDLQVGAGTIDIDQLDIQKLNADCGAGEIDMVVTGKEKDYNYDLSCGMGEINLEDSEYSGIGIEKTFPMKVPEKIWCWNAEWARLMWSLLGKAKSCRKLFSDTLWCKVM